MIKTKEGYVEIDVNGLKVKLKDDDRIAQSVLGGKPFEPKTLQFVYDHFDANVGDARFMNAFVDIGCYSGLFSFIAKKMMFDAFGFEPFPPNQQQISANMKLNEIIFALYPVALSDKTGQARFGHTDVHLTSGGSLERKGSNGLTVQTQRLDDFWTFDKKISLIKMDVERHEPAVLRGGLKTIKEHRPVMIIEANDEAMTKEVTTLIDQELGFYAPPFVLDQRNLVFVPR